MMNSPYEELEYLSEYLPEEGEAVLVTRRDGELVCESYQRETALNGVRDPELYGRLVQANERLTSLMALPFWVCVVVFFWGCIALHKFAGLGWDAFYWDVGMVILLLPAGMVWVKRRQARLFRREIRPSLNRQFRRHGVDRFAVIGAMQMHPELKTIMNEMSRNMD